MIEAYPFCWPIGQKRTEVINTANFGKYTLTEVRDQVNEEIRAMRGKDVIISSNIPLRADGRPYIDYQRRSINDKGVAVYFTLNDKPMVLACDKWDTVEHNLRAVAKSIEAMRGLGRWGVSEILDRAFTGFKALPAPSTNCWTVLGIDETQDRDTVTKAYKMLARKAHPDNGGTHDTMSALNQAYEKALRFTQ